MPALVLYAAIDGNKSLGYLASSYGGEEQQV